MFVHPVLPRYLPRLVAIRDCKTDSIISALLLTKESYNTEATDETPSELRQDLYVVVIRTAFYARGNGLATILLSVASAGQRIRLQCVSSLVPAYQRMGMSISKQKSTMEYLDDAKLVTMEATYGPNKWTKLGESLVACHGYAMKSWRAPPSVDYGTAFTSVDQVQPPPKRTQATQPTPAHQALGQAQPLH
ncbi:hypothetical protein J8273_7985 [Carpediemonas membranifera]|uniref:Uncharacterized protein n=1 Tax=Carpediemonas membranifera TaxID=201153 RepID=A0A8J6BUR2_9EUKA|nr:hypothetical protein J8273_7985 [Carpediemonas membranifera]|eukprot:KAG9390621.1 hypothetical protein J8273_7985 [Carpediemonas membranifera]